LFPDVEFRLYDWRGHFEDDFVESNIHIMADAGDYDKSIYDNTLCFSDIYTSVENTYDAQVDVASKIVARHVRFKYLFHYSGVSVRRVKGGTILVLPFVGPASGEMCEYFSKDYNGHFELIDESSQKLELWLSRYNNTTRKQVAPLYNCVTNCNCYDCGLSSYITRYLCCLPDSILLMSNVAELTDPKFKLHKCNVVTKDIIASEIDLVFDDVGMVRYKLWNRHRASHAYIHKSLYDNLLRSKKEYEIGISFSGSGDKFRFSSSLVCVTLGDSDAKVNFCGPGGTIIIRSDGIVYSYLDNFSTKTGNVSLSELRRGRVCPSHSRGTLIPFGFWCVFWKFILNDSSIKDLFLDDDFDSSKCHVCGMEICLKQIKYDDS